MGVTVNFGAATGKVDLGGIVNGLGYPNGLFTEGGDVYSGASLMTSATMDAYFGLTYKPLYSPGNINIEVKIITSHVFGGIGAIGAADAPVYVSGTMWPWNNQQEWSPWQKQDLFSQLDTISGSLPPVYGLSQFSELADDVYSYGTDLYQLYNLPGEYGLGNFHTAEFDWTGPATNGEAYSVYINPEAWAKASGLGVTEVNDVLGIVMVKITETPLPTKPYSMTLTASPNSIAADGSSTSAITATVTGANGAPVPNDTVNFFVQGLGTVTGSVVTNNKGQAIATYTSGTTSGTAYVSAVENDDEATNSVSIQLTSSQGSGGGGSGGGSGGGGGGGGGGRHIID